MTEAVSVDSIIARQVALMEDFEKARLAMHEAREDYAKKKAILIKFDNKYGRVIKMMKED